MGSTTIALTKAYYVGGVDVFALIERAYLPRAGFFHKAADAFRGKSGVELTRENILRMEAIKARILLPAGIKEKEISRRVRRSGKLLADRGFRFAVPPEGFMYMPELAQYGISPFSPLPLYRALAAKMVFCAVEERKLDPAATTVAAIARRPTPEFRAALIEICGRVRYIEVLVESAGGGICRELRKDYGVPVIEGPTRRQLETAEIILVFNLPADTGYLKSAAGEKIILCETDGTPMSDIEAVKAAVLKISDRETAGRVPSGYDMPSLLTALTSAGVLSPSKIEVERLLRRGREC